MYAYTSQLEEFHKKEAKKFYVNLISVFGYMNS